MTDCDMFTSDADALRENQNIPYARCFISQGNRGRLLNALRNQLVGMLSTPKHNSVSLVVRLAQ